MQREIFKIWQELNRRASLDDLAELEARLIEKMTDYFKRITLEYYSKDEINKRLSNLSKRLKDFSIERQRDGS